MLRTTSFLTALASLALIAACSDKPDGGTGAGGTPATGSGGSGTGGATSKGGTVGAGGTTVTGSGGTTATTSGGVTSNGGGAIQGGATTVAGGSSTGGSTTAAGGSSSGGGSSLGGATSGGGVGGGAPGGMTGVAGSPMDKANATRGTTVTKAQDYIRLGEVRVLNNNWGSEDLGCNTPMSVFLNNDGKFGWSFDRGTCGGMNKSKPDFPQIEFGIHPFGIGSADVTSPEFSSTNLLPIQLKDVKSMTVNVQNMTAQFEKEGSWNITFEFWVTQRHPVTDPNPGVYAEIMTFWGWQAGRWPAPPGGMGPQGNGANSKVMSGGKSYTLWVQDDQWASGRWRYFQYRADDGPKKDFNGTLDVKPFIDYLVNTKMYSQDFWISRLEVGSEIDDQTKGTVQMSGITFEVNGQSRSAITN